VLQWTTQSTQSAMRFTKKLFEQSSRDARWQRSYHLGNCVQHAIK